MRALDRNKQTIYYANYVSDSEVVDGNGLYTGEKTVVYSTPSMAKVNISASRGEASLDLFGTDVNYSNTIITDKDLGMNENSIIWYGASTSTPHNYVVVSVAKSINSVTYAIRKVDVG